MFCLARRNSPWVTRIFGGAAGNEGSSKMGTTNNIVINHILMIRDGAFLLLFWYCTSYALSVTLEYLTTNNLRFRLELRRQRRLSLWCTISTYPNTVIAVRWCAHLYVSISMTRVHLKHNTYPVIQYKFCCSLCK